MRKNWFRIRSIREKLLISCSVVTLIPLLALELVYIVQANKSSYEREIRDAEVVAERLINNYKVEMEKAELVVNTLAEFTPLNTYLNRLFRTPAEARNYYKQNIYPLIAPHNSINSGLRIRIYHNRPSKHSALEISEKLDSFVNKNFSFDPFLSGQSFWTSIDCYTFNPVISFFKPVFDSTNYKSIAYVVSGHIKESYLYARIADERADERLMLLTDSKGNILTSNDRTVVGKSLNVLGDSIISASDGTDVWIENEAYYIILRESNELRFYVLLPRDRLVRQSLLSIAQIVGIGVILMIISTALVYYVTRKMTAGMSALAETMSNVNRSSIHLLAKRTIDEQSNDEVDRLEIAFTKMMHEIDELLDKIKDDERRIGEEVITRQAAELRYLQQQINPHYLFNTLESIRMNLVSKHDFENANIVKLFGESFRRYIDMKDEYSSIYEEMAFLEKYISIQNYRLSNRIRYEAEESPTVMNYRIPKLLIQPVVENAVIHGFEENESGGMIRVSIQCKGNNILIRVTDSGKGMPEEMLERLRTHIYGSNASGSIGLRNVYRRLRLIYGERANMTIESAVDMGTIVEMTIPKDNGGYNVSSSDC